MLNNKDREVICSLVVYKKMMEYCLKHHVRCQNQFEPEQPDVLPFAEIYRRMKQEENNK